MRAQSKRTIGDFVYDRLTNDDRRQLRAWMAEAYGEDPHSEAYFDLASTGRRVTGVPPFEEADLRAMLETLAVVRNEPRTTPGVWDCLTEGAFREGADAVRTLFEEADRGGETSVFLRCDLAGR